MRGVRQLTEGTREKSVDEFGVRQVELYHNDAGKAYYLLEGPDAESVRQHHAAWGSLRRRAPGVDAALTPVLL